jgi:sodium-dependent dicarboxylate transporter 2/3/5
LTVAAWVALPLLADLLPRDVLVDGTVAVVAALLLFVIPDGTAKDRKTRPLLTWNEANRAPWDVIMLFGGGLALAAGIGASGLDTWLSVALAPLKAVHPLVVALLLVALVVIITEFASNVAAASGIIPVVAGIIAATGVDPILLALPAAWAASWGFMLPSGTGLNAIAWASGHIALPRMLKAGLLLDLAGVPLLVGTVWLLAPVLR